MKKRVLFLINSLGGGGAERVLVNLVNHLDLSKYEITIQTIFSAGENLSILSNMIKLFECNTISFPGISRLFKLIPAELLYKHFIKKDYDIVVSYLEGITMKIVAGAPVGVKKISWLHNEKLFLNEVFFPKEIKKILSSFDKIVGVSDQVCKSFTENYGISKNVVRIYNTNDVEKIIKFSQDSSFDTSTEKSGKKIKLISLGRLDKAKGYSRLLGVCARLRKEGLTFELTILGTGVERENLEKLKNKLNLQTCVFFKGFYSNPYPILKKSELFVCSSIHEGLNTAMSEAIILGVPVISTRVSGATEVLGENCEYGLLVENNEEALYNGLKKLIENPTLLSYYKEKAKERAHFFNPESSVKAVENLLDEVVQCQS